METPPTSFGAPDADYEDIADDPDVAFDEIDDDDIETPEEGEPDERD